MGLTQFWSGCSIHFYPFLLGRNGMFAQPQESAKSSQSLPAAAKENANLFVFRHLSLLTKKNSWQMDVGQLEHYS